METKVCSTCKREFQITNFYRCGYKTSGNIKYANECIDCRKLREKQRYDEQKLELLSRKKSCVHSCGFEANSQL